MSIRRPVAQLAWILMLFYAFLFCRLGSKRECWSLVETFKKWVSYISFQSFYTNTTDKFSKWSIKNSPQKLHIQIILAYYKSYMQRFLILSIQKKNFGNFYFLLTRSNSIWLKSHISHLLPLTDMLQCGRNYITGHSICKTAKNIDQPDNISSSVTQF